jgi:hypothetical protein
LRSVGFGAILGAASVRVIAAATSLSWTLGPGPAGTLIEAKATVPASIGNVQWTAYDSDSLRAMDYPALASPLDHLVATGAIDPSTVRIAMISSPGFDYARALANLYFDIAVAHFEPPALGISTSIANP